MPMVRFVQTAPMADAVAPDERKTREGSVVFLLASRLLLAGAAVGAVFVAYAVYTITVEQPDGTSLFWGVLGERANVSFEWPRALGFFLPVGLLMVVVVAGSALTFVHRATLARGQGRWRFTPAALTVVQSAFLLVAVGLAALGVACFVSGAQQDDMAGSSAVWLPSAVLAGVLGFLMRRRPLRPSFRRAAAVVVAGCALSGCATLAQFGRTSMGQPVLDAGFHRVWMTGVPSVQFVSLTCADASDCVESGFGSYGSRLPNERAELAVSTDGARSWSVVALPPGVRLLASPACAGKACMIGPQQSPGGRASRVFSVSFLASGGARLSSAAWQLPARGSPTCVGDDCLLAGTKPLLRGESRPTWPVMWRTGDGGRAWHPVRLPMPPGGGVADGVEGPWCADRLHCMAAVVLAAAGCSGALYSGRCAGHIEMLYTADAGGTWSVSARDLPFSEVSCGPAGVCSGTADRSVGRDAQQLLFAVSTDLGGLGRSCVTPRSARWLPAGQRRTALLWA